MVDLLRNPGRYTVAGLVGIVARSVSRPPSEDPNLNREVLATCRKWGQHFTPAET